MSITQWELVSGQVDKLESALNRLGLPFDVQKGADIQSIELGAGKNRIRINASYGSINVYEKGRKKVQRWVVTGTILDGALPVRAEFDRIELARKHKESLVEKDSTAKLDYNSEEVEVSDE